MMVRILLVVLLAAGVSSAQLQLFLVDAPGSEVPLAGQLDVGTVPSGDLLDTKLRIRNLGSSTLQLVKLRVLGVGFSLQGHPSTPKSLDAGENVDFRIRFRPTSFGMYSAGLHVNETVLILTGNSPPSATISVEQEGVFRLLSSGETVVFGQAERSRSKSLRFRLHNPASTLLTISELAIGEGAFQSADMPASPLLLPPDAALDFTVSYAPETTGIHRTTLLMEGRSFVLEGVGIDPPFPATEVLLETAVLASGQQGTVSVKLAEPPIVSGHGHLQMEFHPALAGAADDPAVQFLDTGTRTIPLSVSEGTTQALLLDAEKAVFQTGTTAGSITFTAYLGARSKQVSVTMPEAPVAIDSTSSGRTATGVEVEVRGFDNTLSTSRITFRFFDTRGGVLTPEPIGANVEEPFRNHYENAQLGGMFSLLAQFPVAGDASQIGSVEIEFTNKFGVNERRRVNF